MKILITGGAGFIGTHTTRALLKQGHQVRLFDNLDPQIHGPNASFPDWQGKVECQRGDILNSDELEKALEGIDVVYHLASLTGVGQSMYEIRHYADTNINGTANLVEVIAKKKQRISRLVLSSSRAVYGEGAALCERCGLVHPQDRKRSNLDKGIFHVFCPSCNMNVKPIATGEGFSCSPVSIYGWSKLQQEEIFRFATKYFNLPVVMLRYFNVYGAGQALNNPYTGVVSIFYARLKNNNPVSLYEKGLPLRDFINIADIVDANLLALDQELLVDNIFNIGSGEILTVCDLVNALGKVMGITPQILDQGEFREGDIFSCFADLEKSKRILGFNPKVSLQQGLEEFVKWADGKKTEDLYEKTVKELSMYGLFGKGAKS
ncbi:MAG: NAD-dependent epimerase/dehydratase family protein [Candidatus Omnitrophica bacterium]|nr:NAD-dependent epimerase/dehydratase family protein [Candidatus Omnitrophota bacterium]